MVCCDAVLPQPHPQSKAPAPTTSMIQGPSCNMPPHSQSRAPAESTHLHPQSRAPSSQKYCHAKKKERADKTNETNRQTKTLKQNATQSCKEDASGGPELDASCMKLRRSIAKKRVRRYGSFFALWYFSLLPQNCFCPSVSEWALRVLQ